MFSAPMFHRERRLPRRGLFVLRTGFAAVLGLVVLLVGHSSLAHPPAGAGAPLLGRSLFIATVSATMLFPASLVPSFAGGTIAEERERDPLPQLLPDGLRSPCAPDRVKPGCARSGTDRG
jgi:hypothetical protein